MKMEVDVGVMMPQVKESPRLLKAGRGKEEAFSYRLPLFLARNVQWLK